MSFTFTIVRYSFAAVVKIRRAQRNVHQTDRSCDLHRATASFSVPHSLRWPSGYVALSMVSRPRLSDLLITVSRIPACCLNGPNRQRAGSPESGIERMISPSVTHHPHSVQRRRQVRLQRIERRYRQSCPAARERYRTFASGRFKWAAKKMAALSVAGPGSDLQAPNAAAVDGRLRLKSQIAVWSIIRTPQ